ncbi:AAA family ATPase [Pantoea ananatis]|uniref:AAA family ATPase n=1 Tax=Pantoea ananas TaxID=553 RepID=UPI00301613DF
MKEPKKRLDIIFHDFLEMIDADLSDSIIRNSQQLRDLNEALNSDSLFLKKLSVSDFKRLREVFVTLEDDLTVFVADNGYGKTTLLDAIAISLSWLRSNIQKKDKPGTYIKDFEINNSQDAQYASIASTFKIQQYNCNLLITNTKEGVPFKRKNELQEIKEIATMYRYVNTLINNSSLPLMAYYSIVRSNVGGGVDNKRKLNKNKTSWSKFDDYEDIVFDRNDFGDFLSWLTFLRNKASHEASDLYLGADQLIKEIESITVTLNQLSLISGIDKNVISNLEISREEKRSMLQKVNANDNNLLNSSAFYKNVTNAILKFLPEFESINLVYGESDVKLVLTKDNIELDAQQLSQGEKTILTLVGDLARRLSLLNPMLENPFEGRGIVLIDEIDLHLHPNWQQQIIERLLTTFPNLQFIISTHSPQVISTVPERCIRILEEYLNEFGGKDIKIVSPRYQTKGLTNNDALLYGMKTDPTPHLKEVTWLNEYKKLIELGEFNDEKGSSLRAKLDGHFGKRHPLILECDELISLVNFKQKLKNKKTQS